MSNNDTNDNRPDYETVEEESNGRGKSFLTVLLMAILIGTGVYAFLRGAPEDVENSIEEQIEEIREEDESNGEDESTDTEENTDTSEETSGDETNEEEASDSTPVASEPQVTAVTDEAISVQASAGDGVTHLARRAIQERLQNQDKELSDAQKIYAETVLTQNEAYYQQSIDPSAEIDFSIQDIDQVIDGAENLSQSQIDAWNMYVPHVQSL